MSTPTGQVANDVISLPVRMFDGHVLVLIDGCEYLVDTGSPVTLLFTQQIELGEKLDTLIRLANVDPSGVRLPATQIGPIVHQHVSPHIAGLIGMDVLAHFECFFAMGQGCLRLFENHPGAPDMCRLAARSNHGVPVIGPAWVGGQQCEMIWDTGAAICYLTSASLLENGVSIGQRWDFHPLSTPNHFQVSTCRLSLDLGEPPSRFSLACAELPGHVASGGLHILGSEVLETADVFLSLRKGIFGFSKRAA